MLKFIFIEKNGNGVLYLTASNFTEALEQLNEKVTNPNGWDCEDEDGESIINSIFDF